MSIPGIEFIITLYYMILDVSLSWPSWTSLLGILGEHCYLGMSGTFGALVSNRSIEQSGDCWEVIHNPILRLNGTNTV